jgi:hypothetical protein
MSEYIGITNNIGEVLRVGLGIYLNESLRRRTQQELSLETDRSCVQSELCSASLIVNVHLLFFFLHIITI